MLWRVQLGMGGWSLINTASGRALTYANASLGLTAFTVAWSQAFVLEDNPVLLQGYQVFSTPAGNALDVPGNTSVQGTQLQLYRGNGSDAQKFLTFAAGGAAVSIQSAQHKLSLDVTGGSSVEGAPVVIWPYAASAHQQFILRPSGDGWFVLQAAHGPYLAAASDSSGAALTITNNKAQAQRFMPAATSFRSWTSGMPELDAKLDFIMNNYLGYDGDVMRKCYDYVCSYAYRSGSLYPSGNWVPGFANEMIDYGSGNCYRFAALLGVLYAYNGISSSVISGGVLLRGGAVGPHSWVEVYINGQTYVVDPEATKDLPGYNFYMNTYGSAPLVYVH
jgi:hypothetical protein